MKASLKNVCLVLCFIMLSIQLKALQESTFTLYNYNKVFFNPAAIGLNINTTINSNFRTQFTGIENSPKAQNIYFSTPINSKIKTGITFSTDQTFIDNLTSVFAIAAYQIKLFKNTYLIFGLQAGGTFLNSNFDTLDLTSDPLFSQNINEFNPNVGIGFYLKNSNYYISLSSPRLLNTKRFIKNSGVTTVANKQFQINTAIGYHFVLNKSLKLSPSTLVRFIKSATLIDSTLTLTFLEKISLGANYRFNSALGGLFHVKIVNWLAVAFAYETNTQDINVIGDGNYEVQFQLNF